MKNILFTILLIAAFVCAAFATTSGVLVEKGNIVYSVDGQNKVQLTTSGKDQRPLLSPDGKKVAFLRKSTKEAYLPIGDTEDYLKMGPDNIFADQIWIVDVDGKNERMLVEDKNPDDDGTGDFKGEDVVAHISHMEFSLDGKKIYFITSAWVTSGALHSVNIDGTGRRFIDGSNYLKVIDKGEYKGNIIVQPHRYKITGGSYDWYYVYTPDGKEVGTLGDDLEQVDWDMFYFEPEKQ